MHLLSGDSFQRRWVDATLHGEGLKLLVFARDVTLQLLRFPHCACRNCPWQPFLPLDVNVGFPFPPFALNPHSELVPAPLARALPAFEHPSL